MSRRRLLVRKNAAAARAAERARDPALKEVPANDKIEIVKLDGAYGCRHCPRAFRTLRSRSAHEETCVGEQLRSLNKSLDGIQKLLKACDCPKCGKTFQSPHGVKVHLARCMA